MKSAAQHSRTAGFSLLEVLAALVILSALSAALWPWFTQAQDERGASTLSRGAGGPFLFLATDPEVLTLEDVALASASLGTDVEVVTDEVARDGRWVWIRFTVGEDAVVRSFLAPVEDATR